MLAKHSFDLFDRAGTNSVKRYKYATIMKMSNQKKIPTPKTDVGKTKLSIRYLYHENIW